MTGPLKPLPIADLYRSADLSGLEFVTTGDLAPAEPLQGQTRARDAIALGTQLRTSGFNLFVTGPPASGMREAVKAALSETAQAKPCPSDWVYVYNFEEPSKPVAIALPPGRGVQFRDEMRDLIAELRIALPAAFEREDYQTRRAAIEEAIHQKQMEAFQALGEKASKQGIAIVRTPMGFALAPAKGGQVVPPDEFNTWSEEERAETQNRINLLEKELEQVLRQVPSWEKERRDQLRELDRETSRLAVGQSLEDTEERFSDLPNVRDHLVQVHADLIENAAMFIASGLDGQMGGEERGIGGLFDRYEVNVLVGQAHGEPCCPVVEEMHPTLVNLIGRVEYAARQGVLLTNFRLIKPGALHRANGGFLVLDARALLSEPYSWPALKRALRQREITIEDVGRFMGLTGTVSLEPDCIPLDVTVVLIGDRMLYHMLAEFDPEFDEHFKVLADFDDDLQRTAETEAMFARIVAGMLQSAGLAPMERDGVARVIEHASRLSDAADKLTLVAEDIRDVLFEANFWASQAGQETIARQHVQRALDERDRRAARIRERSQESILREIALVDTAGTSVGQVNGLSVLQIGKFRFGRPTRITARVRPGSGRVVDIEREVELGGPLHSKGVLILSGFLSGRYALDTPMSLFASLVFEQSYGGVDGDSASSAELYALMSALSGLPLRQDLAVTGSVNQHGQIQAIGGVNEKIEGFFDICRSRGLTGTQGVVIPRSNVQHLMLRADVAKACAEGQFAVYAVSSVDEGIELLTGKPAGEPNDAGVFPEGSVNRAVEERLHAFADVRRQFGGSDSPGEGKPKS